MNFSDYSARPQRHLTHLEDIVLDGPEGIAYALGALQELGSVLSGRGTRNAILSTKWDGSPAIVFGPDPADGQFFVSTKAAFNKTPKLAKSHDDIDAMFSMDLRNIMHCAFDCLPELGARVPIQGDFLFVRPQLRSAAFQQNMYLCFQPNTIVYGIPEWVDGHPSFMARQAAAASLGIALHTEFGPDWTSRPMRSLTYAQLQRSTRVFAVTSDIAVNPDVAVTLTTVPQEDVEEFQFASMMATRYAKHLTYRVFDAVPQLREHLDRFFNQQVRAGLQSHDPSGQVDSFIHYLDDASAAAQAARSSMKGKQVQYLKYRHLQALVYQWRDDLVRLFTLRSYLVDAKITVLTALAQASFVKTFLQTPAGLFPTTPEGVVLTNKTTGISVKLVDRFEFSRANFAHHEAR